MSDTEQTATPQDTATTADHPENLTSVRVARLRPAPDNLRRKIDGTEVARLAKSIESSGLLQPVIVRPIDKNKEGHDYEIVAGHRRVAALVKLGRDVTPAFVHDLTDDQRTEVMLIENLQRVDLNPVEEAHGYFRLVERGMTVKKLAERIGRSQKHVSSRLELMEAPGWLQDVLAAGNTTLAAVEDFMETYREVLPWLDGLEDEERQSVTEAVSAAYGDNGGRWAGSVLVRAKRQSEQERVMAQVRDLAEGKGFTFVEKEPDSYGTLSWPKGHAPLGDLGIDTKAHRSEPCHGIGVTSTSGSPKAIELCTQRSRHTAKGKSTVKPADIDAQTAARQEEKQRRDRQRAERLGYLAQVRDAVNGARQRELTDLVVMWTVEQTLGMRDDERKDLLAAVGVDWRSEDLGSSAERERRVLELATESKASALRVAAASTILAHGMDHAGRLGRRVRVDELLSGFEVDGEG